MKLSTDIERLSKEFRQHREAVADYEKKITALKTKMDKIEIDMLVIMNKTGMTNSKTKYGTFYKSEETHVRVMDREAFLDYIFKNDRRDMLTAGCNKLAAKNYVAELKQPPPGVIVDTETVVRFRKGDTI